MVFTYANDKKVTVKFGTGSSGLITLEMSDITDSL